ncbi:MAG: HAMP domain-containing histidine kinase, partial [Sulfurimonas sp.]|nr:HAMP domain-containing histidine kinase [Sulfurimonas sp.]
IEHPSYMRAKVKNSVHKNVELCQKTVSKKRAIIDTNIKKDKEFTVYDEFKNSSVVVAFIPIQNIKDSKIPAAYLVSYTKDKNIDIILNIAKVINIVVFIMLAIGLYLLYILITKKDELSIAVDVALEKNTKQLQALQQQNKMASMGEMIGAIAHQWRQPLSAISGAIQNLEYDYEDGYLKDKKYINDFVDKQKKTINFMSKTIDDFRSFFRVDKTKRNFKVKETTQNVIDMQSAQLKNHNITLNISGDELEFNGLQSEYQQAILNIINNAKDALIENNIENPTIDIAISNRKVTIKDNGGGIHQDVIDRVFEPYFSTKEQGKGVGMGLYISKMIIDDNMGAKLSVENDKNGAVFTIDLNEYHTPK